MIDRSEDEMEDVIYRLVGELHGSRYQGMSYEDGIRDALEWVLGEPEEEDISWPFINE